MASHRTGTACHRDHDQWPLTISGFFVSVYPRRPLPPPDVRPLRPLCPLPLRGDTTDPAVPESRDPCRSVISLSDSPDAGRSECCTCTHEDRGGTRASRHQVSEPVMEGTRATCRVQQCTSSAARPTRPPAFPHTQLSNTHANGLCVGDGQWCDAHPSFQRRLRRAGPGRRRRRPPACRRLAPRQLAGVAKPGARSTTSVSNCCVLMHKA